MSKNPLAVLGPVLQKDPTSVGDLAQATTRTITGTTRTVSPSQEIRTVAGDAVDKIETAVTSQPRKLNNFGKVVLGTGAVGVGGAGFGLNEILDALAQMPPEERLNVINELAASNPELAEELRQVNNAIAGRSLGVQKFGRNLTGERNAMSDATVTSTVDSLLNPDANEAMQMLDTTYALVRQRMSLAQIKALQFIINNCTESNLNVLEDRWLAHAR